MTSALLPRLGIVTPSFNQGRFIGRTIESVLAQGVEGLDYLVVDGASTDDTLEVLRRYDGVVRILSEPDRGQAHAINKGIGLTRGELVGWLNSDDVYHPGALRAVQRLFAAHPEIDVVYGRADHIDEQDEILEPYPTAEWDARRLRDVCFLCQPATFVRRTAMDACGSLDESLRFCMDYEYWLRLSAAGRTFFYLRRPLAGSRLYAETKTLGQRLAVHREMNYMLRARLGSVPDRWIANYAHVALEHYGLRRERSPRIFLFAVSALTRLAARHWNRDISPRLRRTTAHWARSALRTPGSGSARKSPGRSMGRRLRIGLDVSQTGTEKAGCGAVAESLARALAGLDDRPTLILYPTLGDGYWDSAGPGATLRLDESVARVGLFHSTLAEARAFWRQPPPDLDERLGGVDVVHSHNFYCPAGLRSTRLVYTAHDVAVLEHPEWTSEANRQTCSLGLIQASYRADLIVTPSEAARRSFLRNFPHHPEERTAVLPWASRFHRREGIERPPTLPPFEPSSYFLSVGTLDPRKNLSRLLRAYAAYATASQAPPELALVGAAGLASQELERVIEELGLGSLVHRLGYVDDAELQWLYENCRAFLYASLLEGFGLPALEALSLGAPVLAADNSSLPEVVGDAAILVDPVDERCLREAMVALGEDENLRSELRAKAIGQASRFSWEKTARRALTLYEQALSLEKRHHTHRPGLALTGGTERGPTGDLGAAASSSQRPSRT